MAFVTIGTGVVLIALGLIGFLNSESYAATALIPAYFGAALVVLGFLALKETLRKHAMHSAVLLGLIGFLAGGGRAVQVALSGNIPSWLAFSMTICMAVTCGIFVGLCIKSFIDARRRRQQSNV